MPSEVNDAETRRRVLTRLFGDPVLVVQLDDALAEWEEEGHEEKGALVNDLLRRANEGVDPRFDEVQLSCLNDLWHNDAYEPIRPGIKLPKMVQALRFWRELLALRPDEVAGFHQAVTTWGINRDAESWAALEGYLERLGMAGKMTEEHAKALVYLTMDDTRLRSLRWFGADGDLW